MVFFYSVDVNLSRIATIKNNKLTVEQFANLVKSGRLRFVISQFVITKE
jgi:hypothetical protein